MDLSTIKRQTESLLDMSCSTDSNLQHIKYVMIGYRDYFLTGEARTGMNRPYSPGSARDMSYQVGVQLALYDELMKNRNEPV